MIDKIDATDISENQRYLGLIAQRQENPPEWYLKVLSPLTFEPFIEKRTAEISALYIGNSGLRIAFTHKDADMHFLPNGTASPYFAEKLEMAIANSRIFMFGLYELGQVLQNDSFDWDKITIFPEPALGRILERWPSEIILSKNPYRQNVFTYEIGCTELIRTINSETFKSSSLGNFVEFYKQNQDRWPTMIHPRIQSKVVGNRIKLY